MWQFLHWLLRSLWAGAIHKVHICTPMAHKWDLQEISFVPSHFRPCGHRMGFFWRKELEEWERQAGKYWQVEAHGKDCVEQVDSGSQEAKSEQVMEVPAKLDGLEMTNHLKDLFADVAKREMMLHSVVTIAGSAVVWKWKHNFEVSWVWVNFCTSLRVPDSRSNPFLVTCCCWLSSAISWICSLLGFNRWGITLWCS